MVSIIVPIHNAEKYLKDCINSLINQTFTNLEILLIENGSKDYSAAICDEFKNIDKRIKVYHISSKGVSYARNYGIYQAKGEYISFVDADDFVDKYFIEKLYLEAINEKSDLTFCKINKYCNGKSIELQENAIKYIEQYKFSDYIKKFFWLCAKQDELIMGSCCRVLFKTKIIKDNEIVFSEKQKFCEDLVFLFNCLKASNKKSVILDVLYFYRQNENSYINKYKEDFLLDLEIFYLEIEKIIDDYDLLNKIKYQLTLNVFMEEILKNKNFIKSNYKKIRKSKIYEGFNFSVIKNSVRNAYKNLIMYFLLKYRFYKILIFKYNKNSEIRKCRLK